MTRRLALVRHSTPVVDLAVPAHDWKLSDKGRLRCRTAAEALAGVSANQIFSSAEPKALGTAQEVGRLLGLPVEIAAGVHEHLRPRLPFYEAAEWQRLIADLFAKPDSLILGHETANQAKVRFESAIETLADSAQEDDLIVVTHGTVMSLYLSSALSVDAFSIWKTLEMPDVRIAALDAAG